MTGLLNYSLQTLLCATVICLFTLQRRNFDAYVALIISFWTIAVVLIYAKYGMTQTTLYSNDQDVHIGILNYYLPQEGVVFRFEEIISRRYLVTLPVYYLSKIGLNSVLLFKFQQLIYLVLIYQFGRRFLERNTVRVQWWHILFFCGPIMIFMSTLALRDLAIGFFTLLLVFEPTPTTKICGLIGTFLLRPHLAMALVIGYIVSQIYSYIRPKFYLVSIFILTIAIYWFGTISYFLGSSIQTGTPIGNPINVFTQYKFTRMAANVLGIQFLTLDESIVNASTLTLLLSRLIFIDTWLIPALFLVFLVQHSKHFTHLRIQIYYAFIFFYGLTSQTPWNSSRQNIPFLISMGLLTVVGIESRRHTKTLDLVS
jgi:hypothetical protein